jgi:hypothetical protein
MSVTQLEMYSWKIERKTLETEDDEEIIFATFGNSNWQNDTGKSNRR